MRTIFLILLNFLFFSCSKESSQLEKVCASSDTKSFDFTNDDSSFWGHSDGWTNGGQFLVGWRNDHINFNSGVMELLLDNTACTAGCSGASYAAGEYRSLNFYKYGRFQARLKASSESGTVTSLFTYTGSSDGNPHDEIDIEILGGDITNLHVNYWTNGVQHPKTIALGFDASTAFHEYAFEWTSDKIKWYVDGTLVHTESGSNGTLPSHAGKIMMNYWAVSGWADAGSFSYSVQTKAEYDSFVYKPEHCL